ncbi:MAG: GntR family transcriptional regulator [Tissierellia bacterium]|nr:GntR family transcriptional regulator [Tissierellia bacterium]
MNIIIRNSSDMPIYEQIKEQLKKQIIEGKLKEGEQLPSIRYLAKELRISVITTKRAYDELEIEGFINSVQGKGSFVAIQNQDLIREEYLKKIENYLSEALYYARVSKISKEDIKIMIDALEEENE